MLLEPYFWKLLVSCKIFPEVEKKKHQGLELLDYFTFEAKKQMLHFQDLDKSCRKITPLLATQVSRFTGFPEEAR